MSRASRPSLSLRLALMFALVTALLLGGIGFYLYLSLNKEIAFRDDQALRGRIERMAGLIQGYEDIDALREKPQLYANMLGNTEHFFWVLDSAGTPLITVNPADLPVPDPEADAGMTLRNGGEDTPYRLAAMRLEKDGRRLTLVAGRLLAEKQRMLASYRMQLLAALVAGTLVAFLLGGWVSRRGLRPVRRLARQAATIDSQHLERRLAGGGSYRELAAMTAAFNRMLERLERGFTHLSRFSGDLAHEIRTPLNNLMGQTQQALSQPRSREAYQTLLVSNQEEYERLSRMINSMLFLARAENATTFHREPVDVAATAQQLCEYFEGMAEERGVTLAAPAGGQVLANPELLRTALANLVANALRHAEPGSAITLATAPQSGGLAVTVHNRGPAIADEHLERVFERFFRADAARSEPGDSGGLGLAIVDSIMQRHQGRVWAVNADGGVRMTLWFPGRASTDG